MKLMIVAHPDDESLFGGAQLLQGGWKVACVTNGTNAVRQREFDAAMRLANAEGVIWNHRDQRYRKLDEDAVAADLRALLAEQRWTQIVTHGAAGEYGHQHHVQIHKLVRSLVDEFWVFDVGEPLSAEVWRKKTQLLDVYRSQRSVVTRMLPLARIERITQCLT